MTDAFWNALFIFLGAVLVAGIQAWSAVRTTKAIKTASNLAEAGRSEIVAQVAAADVKTDIARDELRDHQDKEKVALNEIHTLVNNDYGVLLKTAMFTTKRLAILTGFPDDIEAAGLAERAYNDHQAKQAVVDRSQVK